MSNIHFKVELRKPDSPVAKEWQESWTFPTLEEANERIRWFMEYDIYHSLTGWEYRIVEVKAKKRR